MGRCEGLRDQLGTTGRLERKVGALTTGQEFHDGGDLIHTRVQDVGGAHLLGEDAVGRDRVHDDDLFRTG